jgi:hypothetical protein
MNGEIFFMNQILLILHFFGLAAGLSASIGNIIVMRLIRAAPADAPVLAKVPPALAPVAHVGLGLLWLTGLIMVWTVYGGPQNLPTAFWWKLACVIVVTIAVGMIDMTMRAVRAGDRAAAARLPKFGMAAGGFTVLAVIFAVIAFM